jgi:hypothetical protein
MALNVSVVLRANADQLEGELGEAKAALRGLGSEAKSAGSAMSSGLAQGTGVLDRLRGLAGTVRGSFATARNAIGQLALQAQDVAVGLASGQSPFTVLAQQGSQIASLFGPGGAIVGAALAGAGLIAATFLRMGDGLSAAERAANSFKTAMDGVNDTVGKGIAGVEALTKSYAAMSAEMRRVETLRIARETREFEAALPAQQKAMQELLSRAASAVRGDDAAFFSSLADPGAAVRRLRELSPVDAAEALNDMAAATPALREFADQAEEIARASAEATEQLRHLGEAGRALEALAAGAEAELGGRLTGQLKGVQSEVEATTGAFEQMYQDVVGGSYVPDMVTEASAWFDTLATDMTAKSEDATSTVAAAFAGLDRQVSYRLGAMVAHGKTRLEDFASFARDITGQILGSLISVGLNAGFGALFSGGNAATAGAAGSGQAMPEVLHGGGIAGAGGNPKRAAPWALFAAAPRYHQGVLRAGEVPAILMRGERVTPAGQAAGGGQVNIYDQRKGGEAIQTRERRGPNGQRELDILVRDRVESQLARGDHDVAMAARYGVRPALGRR